MSPESIEQAFARLQFGRDIRRPPDERRRGRFRTGWEDATMRGESYGIETLKRLSWRNLGYRLGKHFDPVEDLRPVRWRKLKGNATIRLSDATVCTAELRWYEAHGVGKRELKIKRLFGR